MELKEYRFDEVTSTLIRREFLFLAHSAKKGKENIAITERKE